MIRQVKEISVGPDASGRNWVIMLETDDGHYTLVSFEQIAKIVADVTRRVSNGERPGGG